MLSEIVIELLQFGLEWCAGGTWLDAEQRLDAFFQIGRAV